VPFAGLVLADFGASVVRVDRPAHQAVTPDVLCRGKRSLAVDLKKPEGLEVMRRLLREADVLLDPFRPGVLEKMGLGPEVWLGKDGKKGENERLIIARIAGCVRVSLSPAPLAQSMRSFNKKALNKDTAGHDINYLAMSGALSVRLHDHSLYVSVFDDDQLLPGTPDKPTFPLNLLADFAGGGLTCALGVMLALFERTRSNRGQVVDADMVSGTRYLATYPFLHNALQTPLFASRASPRQLNVLDAGAPFYNVYTCADRRPLAVGCIEPQFFRAFLDGFYRAVPHAWLEKEPWRPDARMQMQKELWPQWRDLLERGFKLKTRDEWARVFAGAFPRSDPSLDVSNETEL
jgi:alpha-methylacyl-CoA racemase